MNVLAAPGTVREGAPTAEGSTAYPLEGDPHRVLTDSDHPGLAALRRHREASFGDRTAGGRGTQMSSSKRFHNMRDRIDPSCAY